MSGGVTCWCGERTIVRTMPEQALTDAANTQVRLCPTHGEFWAAEYRPEDL